MTDDGWHSIIWECQTMNIGDIQRHPELMGGDSCPRVPSPELLLFLQYLSMQLLLAGDIFCIEECGTANLISCGTMEGWSLHYFRRTNWLSEGMETSGFLSRMSATSARPDMHSTSLRVRSQILVKSMLRGFHQTNPSNPHDFVCISTCIPMNTEI